MKVPVPLLGKSIGLTNTHILIIAGLLVGLIMGWDRYSKDMPFFFGLDKQFWLVSPFIAVFVIWVFMTRVGRDVVKEVELDDPYILFEEYLNSPYKWHAGEPCDNPTIKAYQGFQRTGLAGFIYSANSEDIFVGMDGRKDHRGRNRVLHAYPWTKMREMGFKSIWDWERKVGVPVGKQSLADIISQFEDYEQIEILKGMPKALKGDEE